MEGGGGGAGAGRKRGKPDGGTNGAAGGKRARESESFQTGVGSKSKPCTKFFSTSGCPFGEGCHFLHHFPGGYQAVAKMTNLGGPALAPPPVRMPMGAAVPDGPPTPTISRVTGAKLAIRDHESDANLKNIELEGTFDQIKNASAMVRELIVSIGGGAPPQGKKPAGGSHRGGGPGSNFKTKLCENFTKGSCTFGDRCHFAHGENELRKSAAA
uniref:C3H1-type domain-containing protein n=1 Tax=Leersia perrieri TaxID=77586 RepID=A0A0D9VDA1_9ORYZ